MELIVIRHGLPLRIENEDGTPADPPLSSEGREQAQRLGAWLADEHVDRLYASPLRRALETAGPVSDAHGLEIEVEPGVIEFDASAAAYIPIEELKASDYEAWRELVQGQQWALADLAKFQRLVVETLERIVDENSGRRVAVVCHGGVINAWAGHVLGVSNALFFNPTYTSINRFLCASSGERSLVSLNEAAHLRGGA